MTRWQWLRVLSVFNSAPEFVACEQIDERVDYNDQRRPLAVMGGRLAMQCDAIGWDGMRNGNETHTMERTRTYRSEARERKGKIKWQLNGNERLKYRQ